MAAIWDFALSHGYWLLAAVVFAEQIGAPLPATPLLLVMGALAGLGYTTLATSLVVATVSAVAADTIWYLLGRSRGDAILGFLCRLSLEPDTCVRRTSDAFDRWGAFTLLFAKYVPGLSTVAPPLAGSARMHPLRFLWCDTMGSALWAGPMLGLGYIFRHQAEEVMDQVSRFGIGVLVLLLLFTGGWMGFKYIQRRAVLARLAAERITAGELAERLKAGQPTVIVDLRPAREVERSGVRLPGARLMKAQEVEKELRELPGGAHLVFYCS